MADTPIPEDDGDGTANDPPSPPATSSGDWTKIDDFAAGVTDYKPVNFSYIDIGTSVDLAGVYTILSVSGNQVVLSNPALVNPAWDNIGDIGDTTVYASPYLSTDGERWVGPFIIDRPDLDRVFANFVALQGMYGVNKKGKQYARAETALIEITPVDQDGDPTGSPESFSIVLTGSDTDKDAVQVTLRCTLGFTGRVSVRARRTTPTDLNSEHVAVDEIKWQDCYGMAVAPEADYGDVTTVHVRTYATNSALSVTSRQFNLLATRKLPQRISGSSFTTALYATDSAADIISAIALDPYLGRRTPDEIDFDSIYDTIADVKAYFGADTAGEFAYTIDDDGLSFEDTMQTIAQACFCIAYRQGNVMRLSFERATDSSVLLFNFRNVIPDSQTRTPRFGVLDDQDGTELDYTDLDEDEGQTFYIPTDRSASQARSLDIPGPNSRLTAYWQSWRAWNRMQYQNIAIELEATQEAGLVIRNDRVLISDMTRLQRLDGEVEDQDGTDLFLSHDAVLDPEQNYTMFLQHTDGLTEALGVTQRAPDVGDTVDVRRVTLSAVPRLALATDAALAMGGAKYTIVAETDVQQRAFLVTTRDPQSGLTHPLQAVNYSFLYYQNDELVLWLGFDGSFEDAGPYLRDGAAVGGASIVTDTARQQVANGTGTGSKVTLESFVTPTSYTKAAWVKRADLSTAGGILGNAGETFGFAAGANIQAGHGGVAVQVPWPDATDWHHAAVAFDSASGAMVLYLDGLPVAQGTAASRTISQLTALDGFKGRADELRLWKRSLTASEIRAVYLAERNPVSP